MSSTTRITRRTSAAATTVKLPGFDFAADFGREQLAMITDASAAMCRGFEAMRAIQQQAAQQASERHDSAASRMRAATSPGDLMSIALGLLQDDLQSAARYWQDLAGAALEAQTEIVQCAGHLVNTEAALETASAVEALETVPGVSQLFPRTRAAGTRARS